MLLDGALLTLIVALLGGGRLRRLKEVDLRAPALFVLAALVQVALVALAVRGSSLAARAGPAALLGSYALLLGALWLNRRWWGMRLAGLGVLLNLAVIAANGGSMPVDRDLAARAGDAGLLRLLDSPTYPLHHPATDETRLAPLADVLPLPMLVPRPRFFAPGSLGDILITTGACWLILSWLGAFGLRPQGQGRAPG